MLCQRLTTDRAIARIERNVGYGGDGEKSFVMQEWHDGCDLNARGPLYKTPIPHCGFTPERRHRLIEGYRPPRRSAHPAGKGAKSVDCCPRCCPRALFAISLSSQTPARKARPSFYPTMKPPCWPARRGWPAGSSEMLTFGRSIGIPCCRSPGSSLRCPAGGVARIRRLRSS